MNLHRLDLVRDELPKWACIVKECGATVDCPRYKELR